MNHIAYLKIRPFFSWALVATASAAFVSFFISLQFGVIGLFLMIVGWWAWMNFEAGFLLLLIISPLLLIAKATHTISTVTLIKDVVIVVLFMGVVVWPLLKKKLPYRVDVMVLPVLLLWMWTAVAWLLADSFILGALRARDIVLYSLLYFGVLYLPHAFGFLKKRAAWYTATAIVVCLLAIYQWFFAVDSAVLRFDPDRQIWIPRLSSLLVHPSIFGQFLVTAALLWLALLWRVPTKVYRILFAALFLMTLPFIYLTYSRGVWLGFAAGAAVLFVAAQRNIFGWFSRKRLLTLVGACMVGLMLGFFALRATSLGVFLRSTLDPTYASNQIRLEFVARLIAPMTNLQALFGRGLGDVLTQTFREINVTAFDVASGDAASVQLSKDATLVDNQYLKTFVEMGLAGLLIYAVIYWQMVRYSWRLALRDEWVKGVVGLWGMGFVAAFVVQAFFIDIWDIFPTNMIFWVVAAIISAAQSHFFGEVPEVLDKNT